MALIRLAAAAVPLALLCARGGARGGTAMPLKVGFTAANWPSSLQVFHVTRSGNDAVSERSEMLIGDLKRGAPTMWVTSGNEHTFAIRSPDATIRLEVAVANGPRHTSDGPDNDTEPDVVLNFHNVATEDHNAETMNIVYGELGNVVQTVISGLATLALSTVIPGTLSTLSWGRWGG